MRPDVSHSVYQARTAVTAMRDRRRGTYEGSRNPFENKYASGSARHSPPPFKVGGPDPSARETLRRRQGYIPDLKKRQHARATAIDSP